MCCCMQASCSSRAYSQTAGLTCNKHSAIGAEGSTGRKLAEMLQMHSKDAMLVMDVKAMGDACEPQWPKQQNQNRVEGRMASPTPLWMKPNPMTPSKTGQSRRQGHNRIQGPSMISLEWPSGLWKPCSTAAALRLVLSAA